jgi:hypothetical protein
LGARNGRAGRLLPNGRNLKRLLAAGAFDRFTGQVVIRREGFTAATGDGNRHRSSAKAESAVPPILHTTAQSGNGRGKVVSKWQAGEVIDPWSTVLGQQSSVPDFDL